MNSVFVAPDKALAAEAVLEKGVNVRKIRRAYAKWLEEEPSICFCLHVFDCLCFSFDEALLCDGNGNKWLFLFIEKRNINSVCGIFLN